MYAAIFFFLQHKMFILGYTDKITELGDVRSNILLTVIIVCKNSDYKNISVTCVSNDAAAAFGRTVAAMAHEWRGRVK